MAETVRVIVRCRPFNTREKNLNCGIIIQMNSKGHVSIKNPADKSPPKDFQFDQSYFMDSITETIYADTGYSLVESVTQGYNATVFAYGQTGSGKSFTMQGIPDPPTQLGVIPRAFEHIFETIRLAEDTKYLVHAAYIEIYNEEIRDLLGKDPKMKLDLKEHPEKGVYVAGLSMHPVHNSADCDKVMSRGFNNRSVGETLMNKDSSRSHSIFTIFLEMMDEIEGQEKIRAGKLNLVDLAGSERQGKTGATGDRLKEATKINLSLSALGNVISALVDGKSKHIPYRDSKLTRLLQDSLGGNTKTLMVAAISPASDNYDETLSTLRYANRAKNIKNKPKVNEDPKDALLRQYKDEIDKLKAMLAGEMGMDASVLEGFSGEGGGGGGPVDPEVLEQQVQAQLEEEKRKIRDEYEAQMKDLKKMAKGDEKDVVKMEKDMAKMKKKYEKKMLDATNTADEKIEVARASAAAGIDPNKAESMEGGGGRSFQRESKRRASIMVSTDEDFQAQIMDQLKELQGKHNLHLSDSFIKTVMDTVSQKGMSLADKLQAYNNLIFKRLQELQGSLVGGEEAQNSEKKKKKKAKLVHAQAKQDEAEEAAKKFNMTVDEFSKSYNNISDELRDKNDMVKRSKQKIETLQGEIKDLQSEFEFDRIDYLDTMRAQERQMKLLQQMMDKVQPCLKKECNYANLARIKQTAHWDEERMSWKLPELEIVRGGDMSGGGGMGGHGMGGVGMGGGMGGVRGRSIGGGMGQISPGGFTPRGGLSGGGYVQGGMSPMGRGRSPQNQPPDTGETMYMKSSGFDPLGDRKRNNYLAGL